MTDSLPINAQVRQVNILINGSSLALTTMNQLIDVEVEQTQYLPSMFTLRFSDDDLSIIDGSTFTLGASVEIKFDDGSSDTLTTLFKGEITAIEPDFGSDLSLIYTVRGYDKSHRLNRATKTVAHLNITDSDIISTLCGDAGLSATVDSTSTVHDVLIQDNQTDLAFLHERARLNNFVVLVDDTTLYFRSAAERDAVTLNWGKDLLSFNPRVNIARQVNEVEVRGWDVTKKEAIVGTSTTPTASAAPSWDGKKGGATATSATSAAKHVEMRQSVKDQSAADKLATALLDRNNAGFVEAEGVAIGDPNIKAGCTVELNNLGNKFSGKYAVTSTRHSFWQGNYETTFFVEGTRPHLWSEAASTTTGSANQTQRWFGVVPAIVTNNNDEEGTIGRVKVKYPWANDAMESDWLRVASVGAGPERGIQWLPEVNDEVLVAFEHGNFNKGYVLGGLWNGKDALPEAQATAVTGGKVEVRTIKTRIGHIIRLTDKSGEEKIEIIDFNDKLKLTFDSANEDITLDSSGTVNINGGGNINVKGKAAINVEGSNDILVKSGTGNIKITASTGKVEIDGPSKVDIKGTGGVDINSTATLNVKATGMTTVESSGILTLKGSLVKIN